MKTTAVIATALAAAGTTYAESSSPFRLLALSKGASFDGTYVRGSAGRFVLGQQTNTTCGSTAPMFTMTNDTVTTYTDGGASKQELLVDITGAVGGMFSYENYPYNITPDLVTDGFSTAEEDGVEHFLYDQGAWLACPQGSKKGAYNVFAEQAYAKEEGKQSCIPFTIATQKSDEPRACNMV